MLAASKTVETYQGLMVMNDETPRYDEGYNPSEQAQAAAEAVRDGFDLEEMRDADAEQLRDLF